MTLTVVYIPQLDKFNLSRGGYLDYVNNIVYVDWVTYKIFDSGDLRARQAVFASLIVLSKSGGVVIQGEIIPFASAGGATKEDDQNRLRIGQGKP